MRWYRDGAVCERGVAYTAHITSCVGSWLPRCHRLRAMQTHTSTQHRH